ncbi:hypothetical protein KW783_02160 [Candidatus Parcubacteria bacterium]|nr:hypothetical protein [Candidatus Parcubacteria bacterium]
MKSSINFLMLSLVALLLCQIATTNRVQAADLSVACKANTTSTFVGQDVEWVALVSGGNGNYEYSWSGTDNLSGSNASVHKTYSNPGTKSAQVLVTSGNDNTTKFCDSITVEQIPLTGSCSVDTQNFNRDRTVVWSASGFGGNNTYSYQWFGSEFIENEPGSNTQTVTKKYQTAGQKDARVQINSAGDEITLHCRAEIPEPTVQTVPLTGTCTPPSGSIGRNQTATWTAQGAGGAGSFLYSWTGNDGISGMQNSIQRKFQTAGEKIGTVTIESNGQSIHLSCATYISTILVPDSGQSGCFIATAAYGTPDTEEVSTLRNFRDKKLLTNNVGAEFVHWYYNVSPPIADFIRDKSSLKFVVRSVLSPIVFTVRALQ